MSVVVRSNLPEFKAWLQTIKADMRGRAVKAAVGATARVFAAEARRTAPVDRRPKAMHRGRLKKAIYGVASKYRQGQDTVYGVVAARSGRKYQKVRRGKQYANLDAFYWPWVEGGHVARGPGQRIRGGMRRRALERKRLRAAGKWVEGRWFLRRAFQTQQTAALQAFEKRLAISIDRYRRGTT